MNKRDVSADIIRIFAFFGWYQCIFWGIYDFTMKLFWGGGCM